MVYKVYFKSEEFSDEDKKQFEEFGVDYRTLVSLEDSQERKVQAEKIVMKSKKTVKAINKNVRSSPRKINILLKNIRGKKADVAIRDLTFIRKKAAVDVKKVIQSAVANAENNYQHEIDN